MDLWPEGIKYELIGGELFLMTGGTPDHDLINGNVYLLLRRLFAACYVTTGDANLKAECLTEENGYFPDCMVVWIPGLGRKNSLVRRRFSTNDGCSMPAGVKRSIPALSKRLSQTTIKSATSSQPGCKVIQ
jgi:hypothetical protein